WSILDPQGSTVLEEEGVLNDFGTLWGSVDLTSEMPLGAYRVQFNDGSRDLGAATIFRLEEYKLPEFTVRVTPAMDGDAPRVLRPGQEAVIDILAEYTFGGPVAGAQVEAVVSSSPYWMQSPIVRPYPWCYEQPRRGWQPRNVVHRVTLETDAEGRATLRVPPQQADHDIELGIEARVTDSSRREITGTGIVRVTLQGYAVRLEPSHRVVRPGARTEITVRAIDANQRPRSVTGKVTIERQTWRERWIDPRGVEHTVAPRLSRDRIGWTCDRRAYEYEEVLSTSVTTDDEGRGAIAFSPEVAGVYRVTWRSPDDPINGDSEEDELLRDWIEAETLIWAADPSTTEVVHEPTTGIDIIIDRDTFRAGETAPVMLVADATGRWVLFGVEDDSIHDLQVIQMTGDARIVQLPIGIEHQPNVYLHATSVHDGAAAMDTVEVVVPPIDEYLEVVVALDRDAYEPGETGVITVHTTDQDGNPVPAEVGLALIDESILAIQQPFAGDPRKTFFSGRRGHGVRTRASCGSPYVRLVQDPAGDGLVDERVLATGEDRVLELPEQSRDWFGGAVMVDGAMAESQGRGRGNAMRQMAPSSPAGAAPMEMAAADKALSGGEAGGPEDLGNVTVRSDFRSTLLWLPDLTTDEDGAASAEVTFADSLTTWRATARCATTGVQFGMSTANAKTRKPLIARLQAPRFFVVGDETVLSGVLNNNTDEAMQVTVGLQADGLAMRGLMLDGRVQGGERTVVTIPAGGEARVDFSVLAEVSGTANVTLSARAGKHDDGMTKTYPIEAHGIEQLIAHATVLRDGDVTINVELPRARSDTTLAVQVAPSLAVTMLDALPYLVDYPYGCTEQTMSRFLPAVITASTLRDLKLDPDAAMARVFGGIEQAHVDKTHPKKGAGLDALADVFRTSVARLEDTQNADGGWGWWPEGQSDRFMTAYVVWGLALARQAGADVAPTALGRAQKWLDEALVKDERSPSSQAWLLHAAAVAAAITERREGADLREAALENIIASREGLPIYGIALTALAAHEMREPATAEMLARNLASAVKRDNAPGRSIVVRDGARGGSATATAHWGETARWWRWHDGAVETTSFAIRALLAIDPDNELIAPAVNWLIGNRRA
ncbi:MAG: alpha-2-macroglobulin family protein, partial [Planctomycetota bacterium]